MGERGGEMSKAVLYYRAIGDGATVGLPTIDLTAKTPVLTILRLRTGEDKATSSTELLGKRGLYGVLEEALVVYYGRGSGSL